MNRHRTGSAKTKYTREAEMIELIRNRCGQSHWQETREVKTANTREENRK